jgi:glycerol uptake facilitator-like aquaporin
MQKYVSEFLGTFILLLSIVGSGITGQQFTNDQMFILFSHAVVIGFTLIFLIRIFATFSGAHFNPIVSLLFFF